MKKCEKEFLSKIESPSEELFAKLDKDINYDKYNEVKIKPNYLKKTIYKYASLSFVLVCLIVIGFLIKPEDIGSNLGGSHNTSSGNAVISSPGFEDYYLAYFEYQGIRYEVEFYNDKTSKENKKELLGSVELKYYLEGTYNIYRYNAGLALLIIEVENECYLARYRPKTYPFASILEELKYLYNLKDEQMDGTTQSFIKKIELKGEVVDAKYHDDIFYGLLESNLIEKNKRKLNSNSYTSTHTPEVSGTGPTTVSYGLHITTVDDLLYTIRFSHEIGETPTTFKRIKEHRISYRLMNVLTTLIEF